MPQYDGHRPAYPSRQGDHADKARARLRRAGLPDAQAFDAALDALSRLPQPDDTRQRDDRKAARIRTLTETARLRNIPYYFFSPPVVTDAMLSAAALPDDPSPAFRILEPSAGDGAVLDAVAARAPRASLVAVECNPRLRDILLAKGYTVAGSDALCFPDPERPGHARGFDRVLMNPPFGRGGDIAMAHVRALYGRLRPGGRLVSVVPESCVFRRDRAHTAFRAWIDALGGHFVDLPADAFAPARTSVKTRLVVLNRLDQPDPS